MIPIFRPSVTQAEIDAVTETLKSGWWGAGPRAVAFEEAFAKSVGTKHAISLSSCTAALHLVGKAFELPPGSDMVSTPMTFVSSLYIASYNGLNTIFADIEEDTLNIDPEDLKRKMTKKTKLLLPVHYGGHACRMDEINGIAKDAGAKVVEDCAHASGGSYKGKMLGSLSDAGCFSFQAVKNLATGDGGMVTTNDSALAERLKILRWLGINKDTSERTNRDQYKWNYMISEVGYKYQMCDLLAAIGVVQLQRLPATNKRRREITKIYNDAFSSVDWIKIPVQKGYANSSNHNYVIKVEKDREKLMEHLSAKGIASGVHYLPAYKHPIFHHVKADCPVAERVWTKIITLPLFPDMTDGEIEQVIAGVKSFR